MASFTKVLARVGVAVTAASGVASVAGETLLSALVSTASILAASALAAPVVTSGCATSAFAATANWVVNNEPADKQAIAITEGENKRMKTVHTSNFY
jgi:hypothetical protein